MQEPIKRIVYDFTPADGETGEVVSILVNPTRTTRKASTATANGDRQTRDLQAIYDAHATDEDRADAAKIEAEFGGDPKKDSKRFNSKMWALKSKVAKRSEAPAS